MTSFPVGAHPRVESCGDRTVVPNKRSVVIGETKERCHLLFGCGHGPLLNTTDVFYHGLDALVANGMAEEIQSVVSDRKSVV